MFQVKNNVDYRQIMMNNKKSYVKLSDREKK